MGAASGRLEELVGRSNYLQTPIKDLQALDYAVQKVGGSTGSLDVALRTMQFNVSQAASGQGQAFKTLRDDLQLNAGLLAKESTTQQLVSIQQALAKLKDQSKSLGLAKNIFGENVATIGALMKSNLQESYAAFEKLGTGIDASQEKIVRMNMIAKANFAQLAEGFMNQFTVPFLDVMTKVLKGVEDFITKAGGVKPAAATIALAVIDIFQAIEKSVGGVEGAILRVEYALNAIILKYKQAQGFGVALGEKAGQLTYFADKFDEGRQKGMSGEDAYAYAQKQVDKVDSDPQVFKDIVKLEGEQAEILKRIEAAQKKSSGDSALDSTRKYLQDQISNATDPMKILSSSAVSAADNITRYTQNFTEKQNQAANAADKLSAALETAQKKAVTWLQNPESHMGKDLKGLLDERDKEGQAQQIDTPLDLKREILDAYDEIASLKPGESTDLAQSLVHSIQLSSLGMQSQFGGKATRGIQNMVNDLQTFLTQKNLASQKVAVTVDLDLTDEMKKIIKVNGVYTSQDTIDTLNNLKNGNIMNIGLSAAARAAAQ